MPARNAATTIDTALRSLAAQSWQNLEILVVDNGSKDNTREIVRIWAARDNRIRLLDGSAEPGAYCARNIGVAAACGEYLTVLDADDWAHPARIALQTKALLRSPDHAASMSNWVRVTPELRFTRWWQDAGHIHPDISSLMVRAEVRETLGFWDRSRVGADTEYHDRILARFGPSAVIEVAPGVPLNMGRLHGQSLTQDPATGIESQVFGARRSYAMAARRWHRRASGQLHLAQFPARRPFNIPPALALSDPAAIPTPETWYEHTDLLDEAWYLRSYPDLRQIDADAITHYVIKGAGEGRDPGPDFSTTGYAMTQDLRPDQALQHYLSKGRTNGAPALPVWQGALAAPASGRHLLVFGHQANAELFGAERCLPQLLARAIKAGFTPSVVLPRIMNAAYLETLRALSYRVHVLPYGWIYGGVAPDPRTIDRLTRLIRDLDIAAVHQNTVVLDAPLRAAKAAGVPVVVHAHELPHTDPRLCFDLGLSAEELRAHILSYATRFTANSQAVMDWLDVPTERIDLVQNQVEPELAKLPFEPTTPLRIALIGSLTARKGIADFIAVARAFSRMGGRAEFRLIGSTSHDLDRLTPLPDNMRHMGYAPSPTAAIAQADIVLSLSKVAESYGLTVLEALTAGRPVLCYDRGTPPDLVGRDQNAGRILPPDDPTAVARALFDMVKADPSLAMASEAARKRGALISQNMEMQFSEAFFVPR
ncbi:MAG: glycosyltransferase [Roseovarius sp.]|nr:glycosyltransferase [Roseovarius sp.]